MSTTELPAKVALPDHTQLPDHDGTFVQNFQELPQSLVLTDSIEPFLKRLHPDGQFLIGQDCGIYWRVTDPPLRGAKAPDWFYVPGAPPSLDGKPRRSYVLWHEVLSPLILLEYVSGDGSEERDRTPFQGKFWVYEHAIRPAFYGIFEADLARIEMYHLVENRFERMEPNARGRYPINGLGLELGIWSGPILGLDYPYMRWWDAEGNMLLTGHELAEIDSARADREAARADQLAAQLRALGIEPEA